MAIYSLFFKVIIGKPHFHAFSHNTSKWEVFISLVPAVLKILHMSDSHTKWIQGAVCASSTATNFLIPDIVPCPKKQLSSW